MGCGLLRKDSPYRQQRQDLGASGRRDKQVTFGSLLYQPRKKDGLSVKRVPFSIRRMGALSGRNKWAR